jgi:hypothetical protein
MSHSKIVQALRIYCDTLVTETPALGVYTNGSISEIRLSEEPLVGTTLTWASGLIALNGIPARTESGDTRRGGCVADYSGLSVSLIHTNRWVLELEALGINLGNLTAELWEFVGTESDSDATSAAVKFTGVIAEGREWDEAGISIPIKNAAYKRNACILATSESGTVIPATFGTHTPPAPGTVINNLAKFARTNEVIKVLDDDYFTGSGDKLSVFPVTSKQSTYVYRCRLKSNSLSLATLTSDTYVEIVSGASAAIGQPRKVTALNILSVSGIIYLEYTVDYVYQVELTLTGDDRAWVRFTDIGRDYACDTWPCKDFLKYEDGSVVEKPEIYSFDDSNKKFHRLADIAFINTTADNNEIKIDGTHYDDDVDNITGFIALPITSLELESAADLTAWNCNSIDFAAYRFSSAYTAQYPLKLINGLYKPTTAGNIPNGDLTITDQTLVNAAYAYDRNHATQADFIPVITYNTTARLLYLKVLKFGLPKLPENVDVESVYLGIKAYTATQLSGGGGVATKPNDLGSSFFVIFKRFAYTKSTDMIMDDKSIVAAEGSASTTPTGVWMRDIMDQYFTSTPNTGNYYFYKQSAPSAGQYATLDGYELFKIGDSLDDYRSYIEGGLFFNRTHPQGAPAISEEIVDQLSIFQMCIIFKLRSQSIKDAIFSPLAGRIYDDTWGGRVTQTDQITAIVPTIEHLKRLQNWSETGETGISWGLEYATSAKIKTGVAEGSYDSATLPVETCAFQVTDKAEGETGALVARLARAIDVCTYIASDGTECIETLDLTDPVETITFADLNGDIGRVIEPETADVFCEPVVNYLYNRGSGSYDGHLVIKDIQKYAEGGLWTDSSSGFDNEAQAVAVLDIYAALWRKFRTTEPAPSDFTDVPFFTTAAQAAAYLTRKGSHMGRRRVSLSVFYSKGGAYHFAKHVKVNLPHQTRGLDVECFIEGITIDKNANKCDLRLVILSTGEGADVWIDTVDSTDVKIDTDTSTTVVQDIVG